MHAISLLEQTGKLVHVEHAPVGNKKCPRDLRTGKLSVPFSNEHVGTCPDRDNQSHSRMVADKVLPDAESQTNLTQELQKVNGTFSTFAQALRVSAKVQQKPSG